MNLKPFTIAVPLLILLTSCAASASKTAEEFLNAAQSGNSSTVQQMLCVQSDAKTNPLNAVRGWKILQEDSAKNHKVVSARIDSSNAAGQQITKDWKLEVWKTDDAIANNKRVFDELRSKGIQIQDTSPNRSDWSPRRSCVVIEDES